MLHLQKVESLGATPIVIPFEESYSAVQSGVVDGHEQAPYTRLMANLEESTDYFSLDKHTMNTALSKINKEFLAGISEEDQEILLLAESEAKKALLAHIDESTDYDLKQIEVAGVEIIELPSEEFQKIQDIVIGPVVEYFERDWMTEYE